MIRRIHPAVQHGMRRPHPLVHDGQILPVRARGLHGLHLLVAAGGIGTGRGMLAAMALGAEGVQIGTRFALTEESSAHPDFKALGLDLAEGDTKLLLKKLSPTRLVKGAFRRAVEEAEDRGASPDELRELLGRGRAKLGMFEGNLTEGELELGQVASLFHCRQSVAEVMSEILAEYDDALRSMAHYCEG